MLSVPAILLLENPSAPPDSNETCNFSSYNVTVDRLGNAEIVAQGCTIYSGSAWGPGTLDNIGGGASRAVRSCHTGS